MTQEQAKEKAEELYYKIEDELDHDGIYWNLDIQVKKVALICIDEMLNISDDSNEQRFLEQVKQEIEKL
jgi:hypothetical protein